jgi:hypothetical protein
LAAGQFFDAVFVINVCGCAAHPAKYPPINAFEHLMAMHAKAVGAAQAYKGVEAPVAKEGAATVEAKA